MSFVKRMMEEEESRGWHGLKGTHVCPDCFEDRAIIEFIKKNVKHGTCSYCGTEAEELIAAEMDDVLGLIGRCLDREYEPPENGVPWSGREGGWLARVYDTRDLFSKMGFGDCGQKLFEDLVDAFGSNRQWASRWLFSPSPEEALMFTWNEFCRQVKHENRFVFFRTEADKYFGQDYGFANAYDILTEIGRLVVKFDLLTRIPTGLLMFRGRIHSSNEDVETEEQLGPPPLARAKQNRMSPAGLPMFYGADVVDTAFREIDHPDIENDVLFTSGKFEVVEELLVLDLTHLPEVPSLFDEAKLDSRPSLLFLSSFNSDISKPIEFDDAVHYEYVPTQIVAEYFRHVFRTAGGKKIDGIKFKSSKGYVEGNCYTLFFPTFTTHLGSTQRRKIKLVDAKCLGSAVVFREGVERRMKERAKKEAEDGGLFGLG